MLEVRTKNSVYLVDTNSKKICGGVLGNDFVSYVPNTARFMVGLPAIFALEDGRVVQTSTVLSASGF